MQKYKELIKSKTCGELRRAIREIPDWPQKGVSFKDITPLLEDKKLFCKMIDFLVRPYLKEKIDKAVGIDARKNKFP